ncbi:F0F1 ATP synthase subunit B [Actinophytocola sp.]|uniref:F0F1 ATP synthase subunit B n=1 Tax=Actinophytocola sp. TaxID=1872138 RepID=UPI003D6A6512
MPATSALFLAQEEEKPNFLLPNATIIVESLIFAIVLFVMWRFVVPPVRKAMADRREMVQRQADESKKADEKFAAAEQRHREALAEARAEAGKIRDTARAEGQKVLDELRGQASAEVTRLRRAGDEQLAAQREQVVRDLEPHVAELSRTLASRIVGENVAAGGRKR